MSDRPDGDVGVTLRLADTEESRKLWDFTFTLDYKVPVHILFGIGISYLFSKVKIIKRKTTG